ncbi:hypothetical protein JOQ06_027846 [Pogonophryne albipinna]|uniref:Uncharacterized protein n=1 Tax=Pogonophryne albipinna TaxID=1090488 RepID=A0AAD6F2R4_9TELE|nr:hypothetical protein JOQ06_027846 [Pogonophryne albipinna]
MQLIELLGLALYFISMNVNHLVMSVVGISLLIVTTAGQALFHLLTCVERYLAVVHPITYLGLRQGRGSKKPRSSSSATSHSDHFTYHSIFMQLNEFLGIALFFTGGFIGLRKMFDLGIALLIVPSVGKALFHLLTCVERYLAVVHPITYLGLRQGGGVRIRNLSIGCVCISVLYVLKRPGPGEVGGNRKRVDQSKQRAFYTIMAITGVILLSSLMLPLLFLHRAGKLQCCKQKR